jgi:archaeosine synthase beta-subunit
VSPSATDQRIRRLRGPKPKVDPWKAHGTAVDEERRPDGVVERALTVFLAGAECPFTCSFCDLWRYTIDGPTPAGALPRQIDETLASLDVASVARIKLYNASNFFDRRAVPPEDLPRIADSCGRFRGVTVESHARTIDREATVFARRLESAGGGRLEVAIGLETIHPHACADLNKRLDRDRFDRATSFLTEHRIDLRVFVLLGVPGIPAAESIDWTVRSAEHAARQGAALVSIIPLRGGNGEMERLAALGLFVPPTLRELESALDRCVGWKNTVVTADLWDVERLEACPACCEQRVERLRRLNITDCAEPPVQCVACQ